MDDSNARFHEYLFQVVAVGLSDLMIKANMDLGITLCLTFA